MQIAPGLHRLGNGTVNAYLVADGSEVTIVDAGLPGYWGDLPAELAAMGRTLEDVRAMVLTHGHSDHVGFAERFRTERRIVPRIHELDAAMARGEVKPQHQQSGKTRIGPLVGFLLSGCGTAPSGQNRSSRSRRSATGRRSTSPARPASSTSRATRRAARRSTFAGVDALLVGDAFATRAVTNGHVGPQIAPFSSDPAEALASLARLEGIEARWALPGHGAPWTSGIPAAVEAVRARVASGIPVG